MESSVTHDTGCKKPIKVADGITVYAQYGGENDCYRYKLEHVFSDTPQPSKAVMMLLMNPSAADDKGHTDQTVMKCGRMARRWGYGRLLIANVCAYRATHSEVLMTVADPVGPGNNQAILEMAKGADLIVVGHGVLPRKLQRDANRTVNLLRQAGHTLHVLKVLNCGTPGHPLARGKSFMPENTNPQIWPVR